MNNNEFLEKNGEINQNVRKKIFLREKSKEKKEKSFFSRIKELVFPQRKRKRGRPRKAPPLVAFIKKYTPGVIIVLILVGVFFYFLSERRVLIQVSVIGDNEVISSPDTLKAEAEQKIVAEEVRVVKKETSQKFVKGEVVNLFNPGVLPRLSFYGMALGRIDDFRNGITLSNGPGEARQGLAINFTRPLNLFAGYIHLYGNAVQGTGKVRLLFRDKHFRSTAQDDKDIFLTLTEQSGIQSLIVQTNEISTKIDWRAITQIRIDISAESDAPFIMSIKDLKFSKGL